MNAKAATETAAFRLFHRELVTGARVIGSRRPLR
jgi:hypothetical protein